MGTNMNDIALGSESLFILAPSSMAEVFIILRPSPIWCLGFNQGKTSLPPQDELSYVYQMKS